MPLVLFVLGGVVLAIGCVQTIGAGGSTLSGSQEGAIYGRIASISNLEAGAAQDSLLALTTAIVSIIDTDQSTEVDTAGFFYFDGIASGAYFLKAEVDGIDRAFVNTIKVRSDSTSLVLVLASEIPGREENHYDWRGWTINNINPAMRGGIVGNVSQGSSSMRPLPCGSARVSIGTIWYVDTDSLGSYHLDGILPGEYTVYARHSCLKPGADKVFDKEPYYSSHRAVPQVSIQAGRTSLVDISLCALGPQIPEGCSSQKWNSKFID